jgi:hypothetical protein
VNRLDELVWLLGASVRFVFKLFDNAGKFFNTKGTKNPRRRKLLVSSRQWKERRELGYAELFGARIRVEPCFM